MKLPNGRARIEEGMSAVCLIRPVAYMADLLKASPVGQGHRLCFVASSCPYDFY